MPTKSSLSRASGQTRLTTAVAVLSDDLNDELSEHLNIIRKKIDQYVISSKE